MKQLKHPFLLSLAVLIAILANSVNSVECGRDARLYLDNIRAKVIVVEPMEVTNLAFLSFLNEKRRERIDHLKRTVLQTFHRSSTFSVVSIRQQPRQCRRYENDLSVFADTQVTKSSIEINNHVLLGAEATAKDMFTAVEHYTSSSSLPALHVVVIFAESFAAGNSPPTGFGCSSDPPTAREASAVFEKGNAMVVFVSPEASYVEKWNVDFRTSDDSLHFAPSVVYPLLSQHPKYDRSNDILASLVRSKVLQKACSDHKGLAVQVPKPGCFIASDTALELVWLFNPRSKGAHLQFSKGMGSKLKKLLDKLKVQFSEVKAGVATYGSKLGDGCYTRIQSLTSELDTAVDSLKNQSIFEGDGSPDVPFVGVSLALSDPAMGWTTTALNEKGKLVTKNGKGQNVLKMVLLSTDTTSTLPVSVGPDRGWGKPRDNCNIINNPLPSELGQILRKADVTLNVFLSSNTTEQAWIRYTKDMRAEGAAVEMIPITLLSDSLMTETSDESHDMVLVKNLLRFITRRQCSGRTAVSPSSATTPNTSVIEPPSSPEEPLLTSTDPTATDSTETDKLSLWQASMQMDEALSSAATRLGGLRCWLFFLVAIALYSFSPV